MSANPVTVRRGDHALIERYFQVSLYLLITVGFATLVTTGKLDILSIVFVGAALVYRGWQLASGHSSRIPERATTWLTVGYAAFYLADFLFLSASFVTATVHLVLFSMVVKIFSIQRDRDHLYLAALAFVEVLSAAILTVDSVFLFFFCVFMLAAVTTFISMEMRRAAGAASVMGTRNGDAAEAAPRLRSSAGPHVSLRVRLRRMPAAITTTGFAIMLAIFAGAAGIFFMLPRVSAGYLSAFAPRNDIVSGFGNDINLGQIGVIQQSNVVIMHVTIEGAHGQALDFKWRGIALDYFGGRGWTSRSETYGNSLRNTGDGHFDLLRLRRRYGWYGQEYQRFQSLRYRVLMEPVGLSVFFLVPSPDALSGNFQRIWMDDNGSIYGDDNRAMGEYQGWSNVARPTAGELRTAGTRIPSGLVDRFLQEPSTLNAKIPALAQKIITDAGATTEYDKAVAIEQYLRTNFGYTLQLPQSRQEDPLANFLFERKQGHCEYFASAMAMMLRTQGVPTRVVNGFRTGEYNDLTGSYIIRARNAHSWVEVYFPGFGWVDFDPTPGGSNGDVATSGWGRVALYMDAMREFWREWVINYDFAHQRTLTTEAVVNTRQAITRGRTWIRHQYFELLTRARLVRVKAGNQPVKWWGSTLAILVLCVLGLNVARLRRVWMRRRLVRAPERAPRAAAGLWYERMTKRLARRGWRKRPEQSAREFTQTIHDVAVRQRVETFTDSYERARFGGSAEDAKQLPELYEELVEK